ncbi:MAG: serine hydrolase domain-containing protein [Pseudomonadota bacterium]
MVNQATTRPEAFGIDGPRLDRLGPWMERWVAAGKIPGGQALVARRGEIVWHGCAGQRDVENTVPWQPDTLARIYSMTKPVTSVALMMLYEDGLCHLDDPVEAYLPEFRDMHVLRVNATAIDQTVPCETRPTLHHLLTHTSGLAYDFNDGVLAEAMQARKINYGPTGSTIAETVRQIAELPLAFQPGSRWTYGVSTDVLGRVVEVISGQSLDRFFAERIFEPLGMTDTAFSVPAGKIDRLASCYARGEGDTMELFDPGRTSVFRDVTLLSGGGGLISTAADYYTFTEMLRNRGALGDVCLLGSRTVGLMASNALPGDLASMGQAVFSEVPFDGIGFGLGFAVMLDPARAQTLASVGDFGWGGLASTVFWVDPVEDMTVIFLTQLIPSSSYPLRKELRALVYSSLIDGA